MKQMLITGAGGFIGGHIVEKCLHEGCAVYALAHKHIPSRLAQLAESQSISLITADIRDSARLTEIFRPLPRLDALIHCAAKASDTGRDADFKSVNYEAVKHLARLAQQHATERFVFISTTDVYGLHDFSGQTEERLGYETRPINPYPKYKILAEKWLRKELPPERYSIIRPAAVWGEDDPTLTARVREFLRWSPFIIHFGSWRGKNRWPLAHVREVALAAYLAAFLEEARGQTIHVLDERRTSIDEFYHQVAATYFPGKKYRTVCLPLWCGFIIGAISTGLSNLFNTAKPLWDPTLYALYSVTHDLDFSAENFKKLKGAGQAISNGHARPTRG